MGRLAGLIGGSTLLGLVAVSACGDDSGGGSATDAGSSFDASALDAMPGPGPCSITVGASAIPTEDIEVPSVEGQAVLFNAPDGTLLGSATTDASGTAAFDACVANTIITAVLRPPPVSMGVPADYAEVFSYTGVQPLDEVFLGSNVDPFLESFAATLNVAASADVTVDPSASAWNARTACSSNGDVFGTGNAPVNLVLDVDAECDPLGGPVNVFAWLSGDSGPSAYAFAKGVEVADGAEVAVSLPAWTAGDPFPEYTGGLANIPAASLGGSLNIEVWSGGRFTSFAGGGSSWTGVPASDPSIAFDGPVPAFIERLVGDSEVVVACNGDTSSSLGIFRTADPATGVVELDFAGSLPAVTELGYSVQDGRPTVSWVADTGLAEANFGLVGAYLEDETVLVYWTVVTHDPGAGAFPLPEFPENLAGLRPSDAAVASFDFATFADFDFTSAREVVKTAGFQPSLFSYYTYAPTVGGSTRVASWYSYCDF